VYRTGFILAVSVPAFTSHARAAQGSPSAIAQSAFAAEEASAREDWASVRSLLEPVVTKETLNGRLWQLLARSYHNTGDFKRALPAYERVFELRQGLPSTAAYSIALCHARLGETDRALEWLQRAVSLGFRYMSDAATEKAFTGLRSDPRFVRLFWQAGPAVLSREKGWGRDLDMLSAEIKRKAVHPFVTRDRDRVEWGTQLTERELDAAVQRLKARVGELSDPQVGIEIQKLLRRVGDGHTGSFAGDGRAALPLNLPILTFDFEEGMYVIAAAKPFAGSLGSRIVAIDGRTLQEVRETLADLISRDNEQWVPQVMPYLLRNTSLLHALGLIRRADQVNLKLADEQGKIREVRVSASDRDANIWNTLPAPPDWVTFHERLGAAAPLYLQRMGDYYWFEYIPTEKAVYFQYNKVLNKERAESLEDFIVRLDTFIAQHKVEKLIVDLRWNNGGNTFLNEVVLHTLMRNPKLAKPGSFVVIIGRRTFSAAMNAAAYFERHMKPIFVGEPTGGRPNSPGDENWETLPYSGVVFNVSDVFWQGGWPYDVRPWLAPHVVSPPRFEAYKAGRDLPLEAALAIHITTDTLRKPH
jgi:tetratricopeptide (TPR) repeat protein